MLRWNKRSDSEKSPIFDAKSAWLYMTIAVSECRSRKVHHSRNAELHQYRPATTGDHLADEERMQYRPVLVRVVYAVAEPDPLSRVPKRTPLGTAQALHGVLAYLRA